MDKVRNSKTKENGRNDEKPVNRHNCQVRDLALNKTFTFKVLDKTGKKTEITCLSFIARANTEAF